RWPTRPPSSSKTSGRGLDLAEEAVRLAVETGREKESGDRPTVAAVAEPQSPEPIVLHRRAAVLLELAAKTAVRVEAVDESVTEVADQDRVVERAEGRRRVRQSPRRAERPARGKPPHERTTSRGDVDDTIAHSRH